MRQKQRRDEKGEGGGVRLSMWSRAIIVSCLLLCQTSCLLLEPIPRFRPNYDNSHGLILDYAAGDRFETLKPMLLIRMTPERWRLTPPGMGGPTIQQYEQNSAQYKSAVRIVPAGTRFLLVAIKRSGDYSPTTYCQIEGSEEWVSVYLGEYTDVDGKIYKQYIREYYRKL